MFRLNTDQYKHLASLVDKVAIAYFAVIGYTSWAKGEFLVVAHAIPMFLALEALALYFLKSPKEPDDESK